MNRFVPMAAVPDLSIPPVAVTDGSANPVRVVLPSRGGYLYGRRPTLGLPLDAATAVVARNWLRLERRRQFVITPVLVTLLVAALATLFLDAHRWVLPVALAVNAAGGFWLASAEKRLTVAQHPEVVGRLGIYLPALPDAVAHEWLRRNAAVQLVTERPRWHRFPPAVHRWTAVACTVAAAVVWWSALRDGEFGLVTLLAFVTLLGAAVTSAVKAFPAGFIRFGD